MKVSDYIARFLRDQGVKHVFAITGGASVHMIDSIAKTTGIEYICPQHEQAGAMMADAYSRATGNLGVAISTSGPGATNMITGVCGAYYDSVPVLFLTGQVATFRLKGDRGIRQLGFQETDTVEIFRPITKYAAIIKDPLKVRFELEKALHIAKSGRQGPVVLDVPDDLQREEINPDELESFIPPKEIRVEVSFDEKIDQCIDLINKAQRPVIVLGWGVRLSKAEEEARKFLGLLEIPVLLTFAMRDFIPSNDPLLIGSFGSHGTRHGNFAVQNSDLVLVVGSRLDSRKSGSPTHDFARGAKKIVVDIDQNELNKFKGLGIEVDILLNADCKSFFERMNEKSEKLQPVDISSWTQKIDDWKKRFPVCSPEYFNEREINPYVFVKSLSSVLEEGDIIVSDTGCGLVWMMQGFDFKKGQRFFHAFNYTPMGWALPASIGACFSSAKKRIICITGDGGLQMNLQELATVMRHKLPIKIFLVNNHGYSMIQQTQDQWLDSKYEAATVDCGLAFPDFEKLAFAYGYRVVTVIENKGLEGKLREVVNNDDPVFCNIEFKPDSRVIPQVKYGRPLEDAEPLLSRKEFFECMLVAPVEISREDN